MAFLNNLVLDNGLSVITSGAQKLHICSSEPTTYAGVASVTLGNKANPSVSSPTARSPSGRKVVVSAITDGAVTATGTATAWAIVDDTNSRLLAAGALAGSQAVTSGNTFTLTSFDIGIPAP